MTGEVEQTASRALLLRRARSVFRRFLFLGLVVQVLELVDATTGVWPLRAVAAAGIVVLAGWAVHVGRTDRASVTGDLAIAAAIAAIGIGLGRSGAVLVGLIAVLPLRALLGQRRDLVTALAGVFVAYGLVTYVNDGFGRVVDLGLVVVVGAASAFSVALRYLGEVLAQHDLSVRLDAVATTAAARLVAATSAADVDEVERWSRRQVAGLGGAASARDAGEPVALVRQRLEADLRLARQRIATEARYRMVAEGSRDGLYLRVAGTGGGYGYLNPAAEAILGVSLADLVADPDLGRELVHEDDRARLVEAVVRDGLVVERTEVRCRRPDGQVRWIAVQERTVDVGDDRWTVLGTLHDVTQRLAEAEALQRVAERERAAADELRHLDAMKSTFLQAVSHELRTPLSAVIGAAQTLDARDAVLTATQRRRMLDIVQRQSSRLERLLIDLLDVDRLSRGLVAPDRRRTSLRVLAEGVVAGLEAAEAARIEIVGDRAPAHVDAPMIERVVDNLVRNALRHTPTEGRIVCHVTSDASGASLVVEDEGPGVPDELKHELFLPFSQGPSSQALPSPGTGIGLALVRALAELHDGRAWIEDRAGGGARFVVWLPPAEPVPADPGDAVVEVLDEAADELPDELTEATATPVTSG